MLRLVRFYGRIAWRSYGVTLQRKDFNLLFLKQIWIIRIILSINFNYYRFDFRGVFRPTDYTDGYRCSVLSCVFLTQIFRIADYCRRKRRWLMSKTSRMAGAIEAPTIRAIRKICVRKNLCPSAICGTKNTSETWIIEISGGNYGNYSNLFQIEFVFESIKQTFT